MKILRTKKLIKPTKLSNQDKKKIGDLLLKGESKLKKEDKDIYKEYIQDARARLKTLREEREATIKQLEKQIEDLKNGE